jgi:hypothetical protein
LTIATFASIGWEGVTLNAAFKSRADSDFLLIGMSIGLFNKEATQSFGNYLRRLAFTWQCHPADAAYLHGGQ